MRLIKHKTTIDFLGATRRKVALAVSALVVVVSIVSLFTHERPLDDIVAAYDMFRNRDDGVIKVAITF